ncbi:hypothetical protein GGS26DRAFT_598963 [Hypomontagnella submonticulosa]|nr:hypothetical protein GGS26DRAFT_598963 [Hypomontagnella submonticulosa]
MALSIRPMPSFDFSKDEKTRNEHHINAILSHCESLLNRGREGLSAFDLQDASCAINDALFMATDTHACESPLLAKCYLYKGHVMWAMKRYVDARDAYKLASTVPSYNSIDRTASEEAAGLAEKMDQEVQDEKRRGGVWLNKYQVEHLHPSQGESRFEYYMRQVRMAGLHYDCPPIQNVQVRRAPCIQSVQLHNLRSPQQVEFHSAWKGAPAGNKLRRSVRRIAPDQYTSYAQGQSTIEMI